MDGDGPADGAHEGTADINDGVFPCRKARREQKAWVF